MALSNSFKRSEFACKCGCGFAAVDAELLAVLEAVRLHFGRPVIINSGCRCQAHNKASGGGPKSKHMLGIAADIVVKGIEPRYVYSYLCDQYPDKYGIGLYSGWVHIDVRADKARW